MYKDGAVAPSPDAEEEHKQRVWAYLQIKHVSAGFFFQNDFNYLQKIFDIYLKDKSEDKIFVLSGTFNVFFFTTIKDRTADTLVNIIKQHIKPEQQ
mgnify:CR=1 FL=1